MRHRAGTRSSTMALFRIGSYRNGTLLATAYFAGTPAMFLLTTLFLQDGLGLAAVFAGMTSIGFALASAVTSWWGGLMVNRVGRPIVVIGVVIVLVSVVGMVLDPRAAGRRRAVGRRGGDGRRRRRRRAGDRAEPDARARGHPGRRGRPRGFGGTARPAHRRGHRRRPSRSRSSTPRSTAKRVTSADRRCTTTPMRSA